MSYNMPDGYVDDNFDDGSPNIYDYIEAKEKIEKAEEILNDVISELIGSRYHQDLLNDLIGLRKVLEK